MKVSFFENNDFLVFETVNRIYNTDHQFDIEVGFDNVIHIEYVLTSGINVYFLVVLKTDYKEIRKTYGLSSWEVEIK